MGANCPDCGELWMNAGPRGDYCASCGYTQTHGADKEPDGEQALDSLNTTQANALIQIGEKAQLFHDPLGMAYGRFDVSGHLETWPLDSRHWKTWLQHSFYKEYGLAPSSAAMISALGVLSGIAQFEGAEHTLYNRVAKFGDSTYYDLTDADWRAVRIDSTGWEIVDRPPILFRRYSHQRPQVEPVHGGDIRDVIHFLNIPEGDRLLELCELVTDFVPDIPHPIRDVYGEKGAAKSVSQRVRRRLIDPSAAETLTFPRNAEALAQMLSHNYAPIFDNVDNIPPWLSDMLCRAVTGDGSSKRRLYSDDDDVIYSYRRVIMLNGINVVAQRPDLLDRTILYRLERIPKHLRRSETDFWKEFEEERPKILGAIFEVLSLAMRVEPTLELPMMERMADFTRWGAAVAEVLDDGKDAFLNAYRENIQIQSREAVEGDLVGAAIQALMEGRDEWEGTPAHLLTALELAADNAKIIRRSSSGKVETKGWPGNPSWLSRRINGVASNLAELGIFIERDQGDERTITISKTAEDRSMQNAVGAVGGVGQNGPSLASPDGTDATDGIIRTPTLSFDVEIA